MRVAAADEKLFAELFDISPFPAVVSRISDHTVIAINRRTSEIFGLAQREAVGIRIVDYYVDPSERQALADLITREGRADNLRLRIRRPDGTPFWALLSSRLVTYGGEHAILTVFTDISDQVAAETALRTSEQRLAAQSKALTDLTARYAHPDEAFDQRLRGILETCAETLQVERLSMWRFGDARRTLRCIGMYLRGDHRYDCGALIYRYECPAYFDAIETERVVAAVDARSDARTLDFRDGYLARFGIGAMLDVPLRKDNVTIGVLCAEHVGGARAWTLDEQNFVISAGNLVSVAVADEERRMALARLAESDLRANLVIDTAHDAFISIDARGTIVTWNARAEHIFGWTRAEAIGRSMDETIIPERFREAHRRGIKRFLDTGEAPVLNQLLELAALHRSGREFPIEITITAPLRLAGGVFFGAFLRDISDRRERDDQLRVAKESAEAATRAKSEFLANMSHELRTPLNGVLGYAQLLQRDPGLTSTQRESLDAIAKCGSHLLDLINDVLDLSKIEAGRLDIEPTPTDLGQLTVDLHYVLADTARRKGLRLTMTIAPEVPHHVIVDGRHLRQVLLNLLGNAVKFTLEGEVALAISRDAYDRLLFEVRDTGIGIEPDALEVIFKAFTQTRAGALAGGSGLGLTISQHLIRRMGDRLHVESTPGVGSRFYFALPLVLGSSSSSEATMSSLPIDARLAPGECVTALVVDDSTVSRRILASLLESAGVRVITAAGGGEALELAPRHRPDIIFMDLRMADVDGLTATRRLKQDPATAAIPVIAVTASAFGDAREAAREAGCVDYLPKPVRAEALFAALQTHLGAAFVTEGDQADAAPDARIDDGERRAQVASRLLGALEIGNVTELDALARELATAGDAEAALASRITDMAADFDFDRLRALAEELASRDDHR